MTRVQRIVNVLSGLISILVAIYLIYSNKEGVDEVLIFIGIVFIGKGINTLFYYISMARFMVGGKISLYSGMIILDFGIFTISIAERMPNTYLVFYLVAIHGFAGLVEILRALEAKSYGNRSYRLKLFHGIVDIVMALICVVLINDLRITVLVYCSGLIYSAIIRIVSAFRRTTMVFIR
jgi:uncharacterized membrane protein HdeD (DUF308 family)